MRVAILHGYELTGSGSNEYTRYLSRALAEAGVEVHVLCREPEPLEIEHATRAWRWDAAGQPELLVERPARSTGSCDIHTLPAASVQPVYLTDKQRDGTVKSFRDLTDAELAEYHRVWVRGARAVLARHPVDIVHANHLIWQPSVAAELGLPFIVFPHGSSIEYVVRRDPRYERSALEALAACDGVISGNVEVLERLVDLDAEDRAGLRDKAQVVGVGVDTALFTPVARDARCTRIAGVAGRFGGKTAAQRNELRARLDAGDLGAVHDYFDAYDHSEPDADAADRLGELPWQTGRVLLFVGSLTAGKGLQSVLCALPEVLESHPDTHLLIVGSGAYREVLEALCHAIDRGDEELFAHLRERGFDLDRSELTGPWTDAVSPVPRRPGFANHVHFLGRMGHDLLQHVFPCADLAVFPSIVPEAYPLVLMESLSNGVLPLVSDFSGFSDGLRTLSGLLDPELVDKMRLPVDAATRVAGIASRITTVLDDPGLGLRSDELRRIAVRNFDWRVRAAEMKHAYARVLRAPARILRS